jgi:hypothetical protein
MFTNNKWSEVVIIDVDHTGMSQRTVLDSMRILPTVLR